MDDLSDYEQELPGSATQKRSASVASSSETQLGKRGLRTGNACDQCKRRKTKCSGRAPCDACHKAAYSCRFDDGRTSRSNRLKPPTVDKQVQHLLAGVLNAIKYNETPVFDGLLHSLRNHESSSEVAEHLRLNLDALQSRGIIPNESIDQGYLLNLVGKVTIDDVDGLLRSGLSTEDREYSFVFEHPKQEKTPNSQRAAVKPSSQGPPYLQQSSLRISNIKFGEANEDSNCTSNTIDGYPATTAYQANGSVTPQASAYYSNAFVQSQSAITVDQPNALGDLNLNQFPASSRRQAQNLANVQANQYTQPYAQKNVYAFHIPEQGSNMASWPWPHTVPSTPATLPPRKRQQMQTHVPTQAYLPQYHHHNIQQLHQQYQNQRSASQGSMQRPNTIQ